MTSADQLSKVHIFQGLPNDVLDKISQAMCYLKVSPNKFVVKVGDVAKEMFFVIGGSVRLLDSQGHEIGIQESGTFFGELGLIYNVPRTCSVQAINDVELGVLQKSDLCALSNIYPNIANSISELGRERFSNFQRELLNFRPKRCDKLDSESFTDDQIIQFKLIFSYYSEGSDQINLDQFGNMLEMIMNTDRKPSTTESQHIFKRLDTNDDGVVKFEEFLNGIHHLSWVVGNVREERSGYQCCHCLIDHLHAMSSKTAIVATMGVLVALSSIVVGTLYIKKSSKYKH